MEKPLPSEWATWQLLDSLLPTGGFAHSYGLETAMQAGFVKTPAQLHLFLLMSLESTAALLLPFVAAAHSLAWRRPSEANGSSDTMREGALGVQVEAIEAGMGSATEPKASSDRTETSPGQHVRDVQMTSAGNEQPLSGPGDRALEMQGIGHASAQVTAWVSLDAALQSMLTNHVARRASTAQGTALLRVAAQIFSGSEFLREVQAYVRATRTGGTSNGRTVNEGGLKLKASSSTKVAGELERPAGIPGEAEESAAGTAETQGSSSGRRTPVRPVNLHHAPVFGAVMGAVGLDLVSAKRAYLFTALRDQLSAATRLNLVGPLEAAAMQYRLATSAEKILSMTTGRSLSDACQVAPLLDVVQGGHDDLFSRLFSS